MQTAAYGNGKQITYGYDANDRLNHILADGIIDFNYQFNDKQQLEWRDEKYMNGVSMWEGLHEAFTYDAVNRLSTATGVGPQLQMTYTSAANPENDRIATKSDAGTYTYQTGNHRISELAAVTGYQPPKHNITYTDEGLIATLTETNNGVVNKILTFGYGIDNQRFKTEYTEDGTRKYTRYYFDTYEKEIQADGTIRNLNYIYAGGDLVAIFEQKTTGDAMHYVYTDYLGSLRCITDASGNVEQKLGFDAWGNRRDPVGGGKTSLSPMLFARGFTGHEHLEEFGLINMNGRVYDPMLGMFISPDNYLQSPDFTQNFNRYAYCLNNPLKYTDPDGEWIQIVVGALMGGLQAGATSLANGDSFWEGFWKGAVVGAVTSAVGSCAGTAVSSALGTSSTLGGCMLNGAITGAAAGFASGFAGSATSAWLNGASFENGLNRGLIGGGYGAIGGGVMGGLIGLASYDAMRRDFKLAMIDIRDLPTNADGSIDYNSETAKRYWEAWFGKTKGLRNIYTGTNGDGLTYKEDEGIYYDNATKQTGDAFTSGIANTKESNVYISKHAFTSQWKLYLVMGHERIHVIHYYCGLYSGKASEYQAYKWMRDQTVRYYPPGHPFLNQTIPEAYTDKMHELFKYDNIKYDYRIFSNY